MFIGPKHASLARDVPKPGVLRQKRKRKKKKRKREKKHEKKKKEEKENKNNKNKITKKLTPEATPGTFCDKAFTPRSHIRSTTTLWKKNEILIPIGIFRTLMRDLQRDLPTSS